MSVRQMTVGGQTKNVREETFDAEKEVWNEYRVGNGDLVRIKVVVHKIFRALDGRGQPAFTPTGDPEVVVQHQIQVTVSSELTPGAEGERH